MRLLTKQNKTKKGNHLTALCGPLFQWFPITVGDPVPTHNPLLSVQFRSFCFVSAWFFHTCFCAAVFPSAGGTTLLAVVLVCFRNLCSATATCQTHTDGSGCKEWQWRVLEAESVAWEPQIKIYYIINLGHFGKYNKSAKISPVSFFFYKLCT